jgi:hypothetical protein
MRDVAEENRRTMSAERAKEILANKEQKMENIQRKMTLLCQEMAQMERPNELLEAAALPGRREMATGDRGEFPDGLKVLERYYRQRQERGREIRLLLGHLSGETQEIWRLWNCFLALQEPYYGILDGLYVKKELYTSVEASSGYSHRMFEKHRKEGLERLSNLFNSPYSSSELLEQA